MKKILLILAISLLSTPYINAQKVKKYFDNGQLKYVKKYKNKKRTGKWKYYYPNGQLRVVQEYKNGTRIGKWEYFYENGKRKEIEEFKKGRLVSKQNFYENGKLKDVSFYDIQKKPIGDWKEYFNNGLLKRKRKYLDGRITSVQTYYENGQLKGIMSYNSRGGENGEWKDYYQNGQLKWDGIFTNGKLNSLKIYFENGQLKESVFTDSLGRLNGDWKEYYKNGKLKWIGKFENGKYVGEWKRYYPNGKLKLVEKFDHNNFSSIRSYYENGQLQEIGYLDYKNEKNGYWKAYNKKWRHFGEIKTIYKNKTYIELRKYGKKVGEWKSYYKSGKIYEIVEFEDDKNTSIKNYYENGQLKNIGFLDSNGKITGDWKSYFDNGKLLISIQNIEKGVSELKMYYKNGPLRFVVKLTDGKFTKDLKFNSLEWIMIKLLKRNFTGELEFYDENGQLRESGKYENGIITGNWKKYYQNGQLASTGEYKKGVKNGKWKYYRNNGKLKAIEEFRNGFLVDVNNTPHSAQQSLEIKELREEVVESEEPVNDKKESLEMVATEVLEEPTQVNEVSIAQVQYPPVYPGCESEKTPQALKDCLNKKIKKFINEEFNTGIAKDLGLFGKRVSIYTKFIIDKDGKVTDIIALSEVKELEKEAKLVIALLPKMKPGRQGNRPVKVRYTIPLEFKIEKE